VPLISRCSGTCFEIVAWSAEFLSPLERSRRCVKRLQELRTPTRAIDKPSKGSCRLKAMTKLTIAQRSTKSRDSVALCAPRWLVTVPYLITWINYPLSDSPSCDPDRFAFYLPLSVAPAESLEAFTNIREGHSVRASTGEVLLSCRRTLTGPSIAVTLPPRERA